MSVLHQSIGIHALIGLDADEIIVGTKGDDHLSGDLGDDLIRGLAGDDQLSGSGGDDTLVGGGGRDILAPGTGFDVVDGGKGVDYLTFDERFAIHVNLTLQGTWQGTGTGKLLATNVEAVLGGGGDDHLIGDANANILTTGAGGNDTLNGGAGDDVLALHMSGDVDHQVIVGSGGVDSLLIEAAATSPVVIDMRSKVEQSVGSGFISMRGVENISVSGDSGADRLIGDDHNNILAAGTGSDWLTGGKGSDLLLGDGFIVESTRGGEVQTVTYDWSSTDGADTLEGGGGFDTLIGGLGDDILRGGDQSDTFAFVIDPVTDHSVDTILDLADEDLIDVSAIDADFGKAGDQAFHIVDAFTGHAGELVRTYVAAENATYFLFDIGGSGAANMTIVAAGDHSDFEGFVL